MESPFSWKGKRDRSRKQSSFLEITKIVTMRLFSGSLSSKMEPRDGVKRRSLLYLNVYDLTPLNGYLYWLGLGIFHSGIQVHGMEYSYGAHEYSSSGIFQVEPRNCPGFIFRRSILLGSTDISLTEFQSFMEQLAAKYNGDTYHLISKNCNHFTDEVCMHLTGKPIPGWVNRLARFGSFLNCLIPAHIQIAAVRRAPDHATFCEDVSDSATTAGSMDSDDDVDDQDHHLLTTPNSEVIFLKEKPARLAK
ncbi:hypothetical protein Nepgr_028498 [Nepenthes gracilis]|uniref:PPPDE domain-containing protein n=1 Tax=Nepenthes gracilis TaxID=150966 RepID=A0AAD3Y407_NEPGR|nr:hypothetical protein Nepgr_028498 [Nepenthes gracilis]